MDADEAGLRARKKLATRAALSSAAMRLALERGLDNVRVDDIAAAAGVSPRTYNNYFSSREEAICSVATDRAQRIGAAIAARPENEPLAEVLVHAVVAEQGGCEPDRNILALVATEPALRGHFLASHMRTEEAIARAIAARLGRKIDLPCRLLAATVTSAARVATGHWLQHEPDTPYRTVLRESLTLALRPLAGLDGSEA
jgi:AcrR family transcriptional regulator